MLFIQASIWVCGNGIRKTKASYKVELNFQSSILYFFSKAKFEQDIFY